MNMCYKNHYYWLDDYGYYYRKRDGTFPHFATEKDLRDSIDDELHKPILEMYKRKTIDVMFLSCKRISQKFELTRQCLNDFYYENPDCPESVKDDVATHIKIMTDRLPESVFYSVKEGYCSPQKFRRIVEKF